MNVNQWFRKIYRNLRPLDTSKDMELSPVLEGGFDNDGRRLIRVTE